MQFEFWETAEGEPVLTLVRPRDGRRLASDMAELEPLAWAALTDLLPAETRAAVRGRSTGAPGVVLDDCLANRDKRARFLEPGCQRLAEILRDWGLDVQAGSPSAARCLDVCCLDVGGMEAPQAREAVRQTEAAMLPEGWLVVRGGDAGLLGECLPGDYHAARLDKPYGNQISVCHRDPEALAAFGERLAELLRALPG